MIRRLIGAALAWMMLGAVSPGPSVNDSLIQGDTLPRKLSEFGLLNDGRTPRPGVKPYTLSTPLFSDYAEKWRFLYLPKGGNLVWRGNGTPEFPVGSVLIKSFGYPADFRKLENDVRIIETRLLIRRTSSWVALPYVWDADGRDATLSRAGQRIELGWTDGDGMPRTLSYAVPNVNQCKGCHDKGGQLSPIGPKAANIASGIDHPAPARPMPRWDDVSAPVALRARAYLDVNCGHCHAKDGPANTSGLWLDWDHAENINLGIGKRPTAAGRGSGNLEFAIAPGHPERSILIYRMQSLDPGIAMPELGRGMVHEEGVALMSEWIRTLRDFKGQ